MVLACFDFTDEKTGAGSGIMTFLTNMKREGSTPSEPHVVVLVRPQSSSFRRMCLHKSSLKLWFDLWEHSRTFTDMILPFLSIPTPLPPTHTHSYRTFHPEPLLAHVTWASTCPMWQLKPVGSWTWQIWASKEGVLKYTPVLHTLLPTPGRHLGTLSPVFSACAGTCAARVCQWLAFPFTGRRKTTAKTPFSSSPNSLRDFVGFCICTYLLSGKNKHLYLALSLRYAMVYPTTVKCMGKLYR